MKESVELGGKDVKIPHLFTLIVIISIIFALIGFWTGIYHILGLDNSILAIPTLFILAFIVSSLAALSISIWSAPEVEFSWGEVRDVKQEKEREISEEENLKQKESSKPVIGFKKKDKLKTREDEFLESYAYQHLFDFVKKVIEEKDIHIYWRKYNLEDLLADVENKSSSDGFADKNSGKSSLDQLRLYVAKKRFYFSEKDFKALVEKELVRQTYTDFKKYVLSRNPQKLDDYILSFLEYVKKYEYPNANLQEVVQGFIDRELDVSYLEKILRDQNIDYSDEDLYEEIRRVCVI